MGALREGFLRLVIISYSGDTRTFFYVSTERGGRGGGGEGHI